MTALAIKARSTRVYSLLAAQSDFLSAPALMPDSVDGWAGWCNADVLNHVCGAGGRNKPNRPLWDAVSLRSGIRCVTFDDAFRGCWPKGGVRKDWETFDLRTLQSCHEDLACLQLPAWVFDQQIRRAEEEFFAAVEELAAAAEADGSVVALPAEASMPVHIDCETCGDLRAITVKDPAAPQITTRVPCPTCTPKADAPVIAPPPPALDAIPGGGQPRAVTPGQRAPDPRLARSDILRMLEDVLARLDELAASGVITRADKQARARAARGVFGGSCISRCAADGTLFGKPMQCPTCGGSTVSEGVKWDYQPGDYRRLAAEFVTDVLRAGSTPPRHVPAVPLSREQARAISDREREAQFDEIAASVFGEEDDSGANETPPTPPTRKRSASDRGEAKGLRVVK